MALAGIPKEQSTWEVGYKAGKEEERNKMIKDGFQRRIRNALETAVSEYRAYITTMNNEHAFVDSYEYIALGRLMSAEKIFWELRRKEQDRSNTQLNELKGSVK